MSDETQKDRSPKCPRIALEDAEKFVRLLHSKIGKSSVKYSVALGAMGYKGESGAALTTLAALNQYGLVDRAQGTVTISPLTLKLLFPTDDTQRHKALVEAALFSGVFRDIFEKYHDCSQDVLASHLIHKGFAIDSAKKIASVYKQNVSFAKLEQGEYSIPEKADKNTASDENKGDSKDDPLKNLSGKMTGTTTFQQSFTVGELPVPIADGLVARVPYPMSEDDFTLLLDTLKLWKKKLTTQKPTVQSSSMNFPVQALWKNKDYDQSVIITGEMGEKDGVKYYQSKDGTGIPASELKFGTAF